MTPERRQVIKDQVGDFGSLLKEIDDVVVVELLNDDDLQAYSDECDRAGYTVEPFEAPGPNGGKQITIGHDPNEFLRRQQIP